MLKYILKLDFYKKKYFFILTFLLIIGSVLFYIIKDLEKKFDLVLSKINAIEIDYKSKLPIFTDYINKEKENELRKFLLPFHIKVASQNNNQPIQNKKELNERIKNNLIININTEETKPYVFFYNLPKEHRYLSKEAADCLILIGKRFQKILEEKGVMYNVKYTISSAVRPFDYQKNLRKINTNAADVSSHSFSHSFDIFYDEYFVTLNKDENKLLFIFQFLENKIYNKFGFLLGQSLRRQFHGVITEALIQLQNENKLYVIWEKTQRCFHVTAR